jgi:protein TonB
MRLVLNRAGQVLSMAMAHSSGHADLDAEASTWIERAEPFPPFPPEFTASRLVLTVPLRFTLQ